MLIIKYDPKKGKVVSDGLVKGWAKGVIENYQKGGQPVTVHISVGATVMIDAIRVLVMEKRINYKEILCEFKKQTIRMDKYATMSDYPKGFCDTHTDILIELIGWQSKNRKE